MRRLRAWVLRLVGTFNAARRDRDLADELESHLQLHIDDNVRAGMAPGEARRRAILVLGGIAQTEERYRDQRGIQVLDQFTQDLRYAARVLRKNPGFSATAVLMLALGIGANTALFGLLDSLLLRSLPVPQPEQLMRLADGERDTFGYPAFDELRRGSSLFSGVIASQSTPNLRRIEEEGVSRPVILQPVSGTYFDVLGVAAWRGRLFHGADAASPGGAVAVISESYWRGRYGSDPSAIGQHFRHANRDFTIVGVASFASATSIESWITSSTVTCNCTSTTTSTPG
jgi:putative ABC transport system permease protein